MDYWKTRSQSALKAKKWANFMKENYMKETEDSVKRTVWFPEMSVVPSVLPRVPETAIFVKQETTVDAIFAETDNYVCALNFASYKNPGGRFLDGSTAQEESLCHESNLYNILSDNRFDDVFYGPHKKMLNRALYHSDMLYTPDVTFLRYGTVKKCSVMTCAAPNKKAAQKYQAVSDSEVHDVMKHRIDSILYNAAIMEDEVLILGAFGCGVFGNDLSEVSEIFRDFIKDKYKGRFRKVIFAVPDSESFAVMKEILS